MKKTGLTFFLCLLFLSVIAQPLHFAHVTDTHVGSQTGKEDLERTIDDLNALSDIDFVLFTGDITEFGSDTELVMSKAIINKLNKPWYIIPGNHDAKWSESGCNSFVKIFGKEQFAFNKGGYLFVGTACGPNMRMAPGLVPHEQILFLDSVLMHMKNPTQPVIFINHYPLNESLSNWYLVLDCLKTRNIQAILLGHGHCNEKFNFEGIPGVMGRSNLRADKLVGGYNLVTIDHDTMTYQERIPGVQTLSPWNKVPLIVRNFKSDTIHYMRPDYSMNKRYSNICSVWQIQDRSDVGTAVTTNGKIAVYANTLGTIVALNVLTGKVIWKYQTLGKVYSTPAIQGNRVVCPSTDGTVYCLSLKTGLLIWSFHTSKAIVASPLIYGKKVFVGASDGKFRAIDLRNGVLCWTFDSVRNFVETRPLYYKKRIYFGSWGNCFYALNASNGSLVWIHQKYSNRMLSPAAVWPVASDGKIFIVAPDRMMTALDARTGKEIWSSKKYSCRESIGMSHDKKLVYVKNMTEGNVDAFYACRNEQSLAWECKADLGYDIAPSPITEEKNVLFVPTDKGVIYAINKQTKQVEWTHKLTNALINCICPLHGNKILVTTLDGIIACLKY